MEKLISLIEFDDLRLKEFAIQKAKDLYGSSNIIKIESSNFPLKYGKDGNPIYGIRIILSPSYIP